MKKAFEIIANISEAFSFTALILSKKTGIDRKSIMCYNYANK